MEIKKPDDTTLEYIKNNYIYHSDTGEIDGPTNRNIGYIEKSQSRYFYRIDIKNRHYRKSHLAWFLHYERWPEQQIDHFDRDSLNDKIGNLREVDDFTQQQNKNNYQGYRGFSIYRKQDGKWRNRNIVIRNQTKGIILGYAKDREEAIRIVDLYYEGDVAGEC